MDTPKTPIDHLRLLARLYLGVGGVIGIIGAGITALSLSGAEAGLLLLIGAPVLFAAIVLLVAGFGMLRGHGWGLVIALICCPVLIGTVFGIPLAAYTVFVAYQYWRSPTRADEGITYDSAPRTLAAPSASALGAHMRILGSLFLLISFFPLFLGWAVTDNAIRDLDRNGWMNPEWLMSIGFLLLTAFVGSAAIGLLRKRTWGVVLACIIALAIAMQFPHGTIVALYTAFVALQTYRQKRAPRPA